jgi:hypothetical protein
MADLYRYDYDASPDAVKELMDGDGHYVPPPRLLEDLTPEQATTVPPGSPYSIAQILYHVVYYQRREIEGLRGKTPSVPSFAHLDDTFAPVTPEEWPALVADFREDMETVKRLSDEYAGAVSPARDDTSANYDLIGTALHNAYHFGQIVLLRRMLGLWPPRSGEDYDF